MTMQFSVRHSGETASRHAKSAAADRRMCRRLVTVTLPVFLVAAAVRRMVAPAPAGRRLSLYAEARASAYATIPFMFMG